MKPQRGHASTQRLTFYSLSPETIIIAGSAFGFAIAG